MDSTSPKTKVCTRCHGEKSVCEFNKQRASRDGYRSVCKTCRHDLEYMPVADKKKAAGRARYKDDRGYQEYFKAKATRQYKQDRERKKEQSRRSALKVKYNLTPQEYDAMLAAQGGVCAICKRPPGKRQLAVDHDHSCCPGDKSCGKCLRGLLCDNCNPSLGGFQDSPAILAQAIHYLSLHQHQP